MRITTSFATYDDVFLRLDNYMADGSLCIKAFNKDGSIATLTKCLCDDSLKHNETYLDVNNCPWVIDFIEHYRIGNLTGKWSGSGYCVYPIVSIDVEEIKKYIQ